MTIDRRDWDREEREALAGLEDQLDAMRRRHANDPPVELLRAAQADALPPELQAAVSAHLAASPMSRALVEEPASDAPLSAGEQERLFARIARETRRERSSSADRWRWLRPVLLGSGLAAASSLVWLVSRPADVGQPGGPPKTQVAVAAPTQAPPFLLPFDTPDVRLGMTALTWRGATPATVDGDRLLADMKPGLDLYRSGDYARANRELTALAARYPGTVEIHFYQGVSRLMLNDAAGAVSAFEAAEAVGDPMFAADIAWYRAVAEQRSGNEASARQRFQSICDARRADAARACTAIVQLDAAGAR